MKKEKRKKNGGEKNKLLNVMVILSNGDIVSPVPICVIIAMPVFHFHVDLEKFHHKF